MSNIETPATAAPLAWLITESEFDEGAAPTALSVVVGSHDTAQAWADRWNVQRIQQIAKQHDAPYAVVDSKIDVVLPEPPPVGLDAQGLERARNAYATIRKGTLTPTRAELDDMRTTVTVLIEAYLGVQ